MKNRIFDVICVAVMIATLLVSGCAGIRRASLTVDGKPVIIHNDTNLSLLEPSVGPLEMAQAYKIKKDADIKETTITGLIKSQASGNSTAKAYNYIFALVNNDTRQAIYIDHPEMTDEKVVARANGGQEFIFLRDIPHKILYRRLSDGKIIKEYYPRNDPYFAEKISHKKKINGVLVDFVLRVNQTS